MDREECLKREKLKLLLGILRKMPVTQLPVPEDSKEHIMVYKNFLVIQEYLTLDKETLFGLEKKAPISLTYSERKTVKEYIEEVLVRRYQPLLDYVSKYEAGSPLESHKNRQKDLSRKLQKRKDVSQELLDAKSRKLELYKEVIEMRCSEEQRLIIDNLFESAKYQGLKMKLFGKALESEMVNSTAYAKAAIKQVEGVIDEIIEKNADKKPSK